MTVPGDVHVVPEGLSAAAAATRALADAVRGLDLAGPIAGAGAALPGSATATQATAMADRWRTSIMAATEAITRHASGLDQTAESYQQSERSIADGLSASGPAVVGQSSMGSGSIRRALG